MVFLNFTSHPRSDILLNVFLAIAVDNLADADALNDKPEDNAELVQVMMMTSLFN